MTRVARLDIRPYEDADEGAVLALLGAALGKQVDDRYRAFFRWKHLENPFGRSFMWVGESEGALVGFRSFLRWRFVGAHAPVEAVRAVDTATDPSRRGLGTFRALTLHALDEMRDAGVELVFNTPNDQSRPGYLKMGWQLAGRAPVQVRPRGPLSLARMLRARSAATLWSEATDVGAPAEEVLSQEGLGELLDAASAAPGPELRTARTPAMLRWRYAGFAPVSSRVVPAGRSLADGFVLLRLRRRGAAVECTVGDQVVPGAPSRAAAAIRGALRSTKADYALAGAAGGEKLPGFATTDRLGPVVAWRGVQQHSSPPPRFRFELGDLELF